VGAGIVDGEACGVDGFDCAHAVAFDAGDLDEAADGVAGHAEVVLHGDFGGVFDGGGVAVECGDEASGGHAASYADFSLTTDLGTGDAGVFFVENADGCGGEEVTEQAGLFFVFGKIVAGVMEEEVGDGGDDACGSVGGSGDDAAAGGVLFVDGHGDEGDGVHGGERVAGFGDSCRSKACCRFIVETCEAFGESGGAAADVEAAGECAFGGDTAFDAVGHGLPEGEDGGFDLVFG